MVEQAASFTIQAPPPISTVGWWARALYGSAVLCPFYGIAGMAITHLREVLNAPPQFQAVQAVPTALGLFGAYFLNQRRNRHNKPKKKSSPQKAKSIALCGMDFPEKHLYHNLIIFGGIGAGKTSAALDWATDQLFKTFNEPGNELGGFFLDVKGNRTTRILKFAHEAGRDVTKCCKIIRPNCSLPYVKLQDPDTGHLFFVPAVQYSTGSEAGRLLSEIQNPQTGEVFPADLFGWPYYQIEPLEANLRKIDFDLTNKDVRFAGWRRQGTNLVRVNHTNGPWQSVEYKVANGRPLSVQYPRRLRYMGMGYIDNGLHGNVVNNNIDPAEAARRLRLIAQLLNNGKSGGDNKFWDDGAENHVVYCIEFLKITNEPGIQVDGPDIARLTTQKPFFSERLKVMNLRIEELKKKIEMKAEPEIEDELRARLKKYTDLVSYFQEEWNVMEGKTKTIMQQVVKQLFNAFLLDDKLQKSFCSKATYSFTTAITKGDVFIFGGCEFETLAKFLGTALKIDFQSAVLARTRMQHLNQTRPIEFENDECQEFAVAGTGSGVGDDRTMSLARESRLINVLATQTMAQLALVLGKDEARTYTAACGGIVAFQISDYGTAEFVSKLVPEVTRERRRLSSSDTKITNLLSPDTKLKENIDYEKQPRFTPNDFMSLNIEQWESIAYNKAQTGDYAKACRQNNLPHPIGSPSGKEELVEFMRWYECASLEELVWERNKGASFDPVPLRATSTEAGIDPNSGTKKLSFVPTVIPGKTIFAEVDSKLKLTGDKLPLQNLQIQSQSPEPVNDAKPIEEATKVVTRISNEPSTAADATETNPLPEKSIPTDPSETSRTTIEAPTACEDAITKADLERIRRLYKDPGVLAEASRKLIAGFEVDLASNYPEFLEQKAAAENPADRSPELGPHGGQFGNKKAAALADALPANPIAEHQRLEPIRRRMDELQKIQRKVSSRGHARVSDQTLRELADDEADPDMMRRFQEEKY